MNSPQGQDDELRRKEQELREREHALRLRELEAEIYQQAKGYEPSVIPTRKHEEPERKLKRQLRNAIKVAKFLGIVVAVIAAVKIGMWLAQVILIGVVAWIGYKLFFESDRRKS